MKSPRYFHYKIYGILISKVECNCVNVVSNNNVVWDETKIINIIHEKQCNALDYGEFWKIAQNKKLVCQEIRKEVTKIL